MLYTIEPPCRDVFVFLLATMGRGVSAMVMTSVVPSNPHGTINKSFATCGSSSL